ncbi:DUF3298 domain-containing protein [Geobacillus stearothermophilus]
MPVCDDRLAYGLYEIAPYTAGIREFSIPFSTLKPYLRLRL